MPDHRNLKGTETEITENKQLIFVNSKMCVKICFQINDVIISLFNHARLTNRKNHWSARELSNERKGMVTQN